MTTTETAAQVTVFSRENCVQCTATKRALDAKKIPYRIIDLDSSPAAADQLRELGFMQLPVVRAEGLSPWSGFRPDKIAEISG